MSNSGHKLLMRQTAPYPQALAELVGRVRYRPGWTVRLGDLVRDDAATHGAEGAGLTLVITTCGYDSYHPDRGETYRVHHYFIVPAATYNEASWLRWLFDCYRQVEEHECMEFFAIASDPDSPDYDCKPSRPFAPLHGPGDDPYVIHEYASELQRRTRFTGEVNP